MFDARCSIFSTDQLKESAPINIDEINLKIIRYLRNGRRSFNEIGENLAISTNTVRARVTKLLKKGVLEIVGVIDPEKIEFC